MIRVYADRQDGRYRLYVTGHAEVSPDKELVCAGVSALSEGLLLFAAENPACRHLRYSAEPGRLFLSCRGGLGGAFDATVRGLCHIAEIYPRDVTVFASLTTKKKQYGIIRQDGEKTARCHERVSI